MNTAPIIKWSGSKRSQAEEIVKRFPHEINTYYEPFCGGCSVLYRLLQTPNIKVKNYVVSDINSDLIETWKEVRDNHERLIDCYAKLWEEFNHIVSRNSNPNVQQQALFEHRKAYFYEVRARLNKEHSPSDFLFVMRTTTNGMPRYNENGDFNNSCHFSRPGISPSKLKRIADDWSALLKSGKVEFRCCSYNSITPEQGDIVYMDPPYASVERNKMYMGGINMDKFFAWLRNVKAKWIMSFDGKRGDSDYTTEIPKDLYERHEYLNSGNSSFERYLGKGSVEQVYESLYISDPTLRVGLVRETEQSCAD